MHVSTNRRVNRSSCSGERSKPRTTSRDGGARSARYLTAVGLALAHDAGDLLVVVVEDLAQQEDRPLHGVEALEHHQERHRE
jgi:hypothetical protein